MKRRRLSDLYVRGRMLAPSDGEGEPVKVWMAKLSELDRDACLRRANAAKARHMINADDEDGELFAAAYAQTREIEEREDLVAFVIADDVAKARRRIEIQRALDDETWNKDDYLQGLLDLWNGDDENPGLAATQEEDPEDPDVKRVWDELGRFQEEINTAVRHEGEMLVKDWDDVEIDVLRRKAAHKLLEMQAMEEFSREFKRQQLFFALRDPVNRRMRYFDSVSEVDDLDDELRNYLNEQFEDLMVDRMEGKDSPPVAVSSNSSGSEGQDSGPVEATA